MARQLQTESRKRTEFECMVRPEIHVPADVDHIRAWHDGPSVRIELGEHGVIVKDHRLETVRTIAPEFEYPWASTSVLPEAFRNPALMMIEQNDLLEGARLVIINLFPLPHFLQKHRDIMLLNIEHVRIGQGREYEWLYLDFSGQFRMKQVIHEGREFGYWGDPEDGESYVITVTKGNAPDKTGTITLMPNMENWDLAQVYKKPERITLGYSRTREEISW